MNFILGQTNTTDLNSPSWIEILFYAVGAIIGIFALIRVAKTGDYKSVLFYPFVGRKPSWYKCLPPYLQSLVNVQALEKYRVRHGIEHEIIANAITGSRWGTIMTQFYVYGHMRESMNRAEATKATIMSRVETTAMMTGRQFKDNEISEIIQAIPDINPWIALQLKIQTLTNPPDVHGLRHELDIILEDTPFKSNMEDIASKYPVDEHILRYFLP